MMKKVLTVSSALLMSTVPALARGPDDNTLVVNGEIEMVTKTEAPAHLDGVLPEIISGWHYRSEETQQLQSDDFENPSMIFVDDAEEAWNTVEGSSGNSCASCHEDAAESMVGVSATYPKWNEEAGQVYTLQNQVNACRTERMGAEPWAYDAGPALNMEALIASHSRGMPVNVAIDGPAAETWEQGREIYYTRYGQLELACSNCHENNNGNHIRADHLSQGHINGFPTYRLRNAALIGTQSRFRGCIRDTRAETFATGSPELVALELYVRSRGNGLSVEGPAVRN
ncbi:sulfur oxidation c-type cytochrome SoxA [Pontibaca salina]|uniref:SoxAX cytochrome complex subunit A n=1 Tax=Pontibaca salina TaxID=2795731 RepID=A0A934HRF4_9RHOB|nr:sulfur oxidation c-type cytochrome SoxA [Pontibaca salina]MBI6630082.1 sulfur oxidation c-type cytochrome SoxA [Pontibaca salina]